MKYFLLLVQERKVKIPASVWEVTACAAAAAVPPLPPHLSVVLYGKFDCESRCFTPKVLSDMSYSFFCSHIFQSLVPQISATFLATSAPLLSAYIYTQKEKNICFPKKLDLA